MTDWIEHDGKDIPVTADTLVYVKFADGYSDDDYESPIRAGDWHNAYFEASSNWVWSEDVPRAAEIVAYRVVEA